MDDDDTDARTCSEEDASIVYEISRLLQVYGDDALDCLQKLHTLLKNRVEQRVEQRGSGATTANTKNNENKNGDCINPSHQATSDSPLQVDDSTLPLEGAVTMAMTAGNVDNIVMQTLQMEQQQQQQRDDQSHGEIEALVQAGVNVIRYWAILQERTTVSTSTPAVATTTDTTAGTRDTCTQPGTREEGITPPNDAHTDNDVNTTQKEDSIMILALTDTLCELMTKFPQNESIQEAACVRLSKQTCLLSTTPKTTTTTTTTTTTASDQTIQRILFPVLQAMNWHKNNPVLWNGGMIVLTRLLVKESSSSSLALTERQSQAMTLIDLTGGLSIFFDALVKQQPSTSKTSKAHKSIQTELKVNVCKALAALAMNHPFNQALISQQPKALPALLDTMKLFAFYVPLQQSLLQILASLAYGPISKPLLLAKGGLDCILTSMKDHHLDPAIQATGCRAIANVFAGTSSDIRVKGSLCVKPTLRAMRMHPPQHLENLIENANHEQDAAGVSDEDENLSSVQIHFYGCAALRNLGKVHARTVIEAGGISTLLVTVSEYPNRPAIQEQAWGALYGILRNDGTTQEDCMSVCTEGGLSTLLLMLRHYSAHRRIQLVGLGCLACLSSTDQILILEQILSGNGLDLVLSALHRYHNEGPPELLQNGSLVLANLTRDNPDFQLAFIIKNGINILFMMLQQAMDDARVQLAACRTLCHLCRNPDNLPQLESSNGAILPTLLAILQANPDYVELNLCVVEILSYLATIPSFQKELVAREGLKLVVDTMKKYDPQTLYISRLLSKNDEVSKNREARDKILLVGCNFLSVVSKDHDATLWMKNHEMLPYLQNLEKQLPRRSPTRPTVRDLISHLQNARVFLAKSGSLASTGRKGRFRQGS